MIGLHDVFAAKKRIRYTVRRTPLQLAPTLSRATEGQIFMKLENQQETGSFKVRGAASAVFALSPEEKAKGVLAVSSGNHGQGVAWAAYYLGIPATILVPEPTPVTKTSAIQFWGARLIKTGKNFDETEAQAAQVLRETGATFIHPCCDPRVIAGQGTVALEILEDAPDIEVIVCPVGGGGLISGIAIVAKAINPKIRVVGVQAAASPAMYYSLQAGKLVEVPMSETLAEGLLGAAYQETLNLVQRYVDDLVLVSEGEIVQAIAWLLLKERQVVEGSGAVSVAALLGGKVGVTGKKTAVVISGGNIDGQTLLAVLEEGAKGQ